MGYPLGTFHITIDLSSDPDAKYSPFAEKATLLIQSVWPVRDLVRSIHNTF